MIQYNPKETDKKCWPEDDYDAVLTMVTEGVSKSSGADMETWQIAVYHPDGREQTIKEYVTAASAFKIKQLAIALGKRAEFDAGTFQAENQVNSSFIVSLSIEESQGDFPDKNRIAKFKPKATRPAPQRTAPSNPRPPATIGAGVREKLANKPAPANPISSDQEFQESDIPF